MGPRLLSQGRIPPPRTQGPGRSWVQARLKGHKLTLVMGSLYRTLALQPEVLALKRTQLKIQVNSLHMHRTLPRRQAAHSYSRLPLQPKRIAILIRWSEKYWEYLIYYEALCASVTPKHPWPGNVLWDCD